VFQFSIKTQAALVIIGGFPQVQKMFSRWSIVFGRRVTRSSLE
jgi:hypothetical protein